MSDILLWANAVRSHLVVWITGSSIAALILMLDKLSQWTLPKWLYVVVFVFTLIAACFGVWQDEHRKVTHDSAELIALAVLRDDFYSRMNDWWTICEDEAKWQMAREAAEAARRNIYDKLAAMSIVYAEEFNTQRADEKLPEVIMLKASACLHPAIMSVYWHRLDRLGHIIQRLQQKIGS